MAVQNFICTDPDRKKYDPHLGKYHPRSWELDAQSSVRGLRLPPRGGDVVRLAEGENGDLAGICAGGPSDKPNIDVITTVAVSLPYRGQGIGELLLEDMLNELPRAAVAARIDYRNTASIKLFDQFGFAPIDYDDEEPGLQIHLLVRG